MAPTRVTRGSFAQLEHRAAPLVQRLERLLALLCFREHGSELEQLEGPAVQRTCRKNTGPREVALMSTAATRNRGASSHKATEAISMSPMRFMARGPAVPATTAWWRYPSATALPRTGRARCKRNRAIARFFDTQAAMSPNKVDRSSWQVVEITTCEYRSRTQSSAGPSSGDPVPPHPRHVRAEEFWRRRVV